jgi:predicted SAM-dependent methyltransferase
MLKLQAMRTAAASSRSAVLSGKRLSSTEWTGSPVAPSHEGVGNLLVNLGCGSRYRSGWTNIDQWGSDPAIVRHDLTRGIPLPDESAAVIYHSHVIEHFDRQGAQKLLRECFRVLRKGGVIRVAAPDLERMVRLYLKALGECLEGSREWRHHYEWLLLEMYDQAVREFPGGEIGDYFRRKSIPNEQFVVERLGLVGKQLITSLRNNNRNVDDDGPFAKRLMRIVKQPSRLRYTLKNLALKMLLSKSELEALELGKFRRSGEVHLWMYDRYSLAETLRSVGFVRPEPFTAFESNIPGWVDYHLDADEDGNVYKSDSLYMEATKDSQSGSFITTGKNCELLRS